MKSFVCASSTLFASGLAFAGGIPHAGDVGVAFVDNKIVTSIVEEEEELRGGLGLPQRVFESTLGTVEFGPFGNDEPGYTSNILPAGARLGFNIRAELKKWNGAGYDGSIAETMQLAQFLGTPGEIERVTSTGFVPGFLFATADDVGFIDEHLSQVLRGADTTRGFADPSDGIYLLELELFTDVSGVANSDPFWIVFNLNRSALEHEQAIDFVVENIVPAPGATIMAAFALTAAARRRRR